LLGRAGTASHRALAFRSPSCGLGRKRNFVGSWAPPSPPSHPEEPNRGGWAPRRGVCMACFCRPRRPDSLPSPSAPNTIRNHPVKAATRHANLAADLIRPRARRRFRYPFGVKAADPYRWARRRQVARSARPGSPPRTSSRAATSTLFPDAEALKKRYARSCASTRSTAPGRAATATST